MKLDELKVADDYLVGKVLANDVINDTNGEVIATANQPISLETIDSFEMEV